MSASPAPEAAIGRVLARARIPRDGVLFVHSAFKTMAREGFDADRTVAALVAYMAPGTLAMPAMSWRYVTPANPHFDEIATPSNTGILAEVFRRRHATHRSLHPTHSAAARGPLAPALTGGHHLDDTPCAAGSPYGQLVEHDAWVAMIGISIDCCTLVHHAEELVAPGLYLRPPAAAETYTCLARDGRSVEVRLRRHLFLPRDYFQFQDQLARAGQLQVDTLGSAVVRFFRARDMISCCLSVLRQAPQAIIALSGRRYRMM